MPGKGGRGRRGAIDGGQPDKQLGHRGAYPDTVAFALAVGDRAEFSGEQLIEAALRRRVEGAQDVIGGLVGGGVRPRVTGRQAP